MGIEFNRTSFTNQYSAFKTAVQNQTDKLSTWKTSMQEKASNISQGNITRASGVVGLIMVVAASKRKCDMVYGQLSPASDLISAIAIIGTALPVLYTQHLKNAKMENERLESLKLKSFIKNKIENQLFHMNPADREAVLTNAGAPFPILLSDIKKFAPNVNSNEIENMCSEYLAEARDTYQEQLEEKIEAIAIEIDAAIEESEDEVESLPSSEEEDEVEGLPSSEEIVVTLVETLDPKIQE